MSKEVTRICLKEAFRYQTFLNRLLSNASNYLSFKDNITVTEAKHLKSVANPDAVDETVVTNAHQETMGDITIDDVVEFIGYLLRQREVLSSKITESKRTAVIDIDSACALNKTRHEIARILTDASRTKAQERHTYDHAYKFNAEGNQTSYRYDVTEVTQINFDRQKMRALADKISETADADSAKIDQTLLTVEVEYTPPFAVSCSWEEALTQFVETRNEQLAARQGAAE